MNLHFIITAKECDAIAALPAGTRQQLGAALLDAIELHEQLLRMAPRYTNMTHAEAFAGELRVRAWRRLLEATGYQPPHALNDPIDPDDLERRLNEYEARW
jgi:hypothetical protein